MSIKIGDKIRYVATSEDGEVVDVSKVSPGCVLVRFGESFEYLIEKESSRWSQLSFRAPQ